MKQLIKTTFLLLALLLPTIAMAHDFEVNGIYYNINGNEAAVTYAGDFSIFRPAYSGSVVIPATVTYNGTTYPVTSIEALAFVECSELTSIVIPNSVTSIGDQVFCDCPGLTSVLVESGNPRYDSRNNCNAIIETAINTLIAGCKNTTIPNSVTAIGFWAFYDCTSLTSIVIPNSVTSIGDAAFENCSGLTNITIPNSVISMGDAAFAECSGLTSVTIGNSVTSIGERAFYDCSSLTSVTIGNSVTNIGDNAFRFCRRLSNVEIGNSVTFIGSSAFAGCWGLTSITIPNSVTSIGASAFEYCGLTSVTIGKSVTSIGERAFYGCGLTDVYCYIADLSRVSNGNRQFYLDNGDYSGRALHVLQGTADAYRADENWYPYFGQIVDDLKPALPGDVNGDIEVNIADVNAVIDIILNGSGNPCGDVNGDGEINIADINAVINIILSGTQN